ncbi:MAG TPA: hypothetical protein VFH66_06625 [Mycobacteriales bacterium]|nr:hypothetical protein [Mycobacteriales bacterium]
MQDLNTAALAKARAAWNAAQVHAVGKVPDNPTTPYLVGSVSSGASVSPRLSGEHGGRPYRIVWQAVGRTLDEVTFAADKADAAFLDQALSVTGQDCTLCEPEVTSPVIRDPDGGALLTCTLTYTFTAYPTGA